MSATAPAAPKVSNAKKFELQDNAGTTKVTYYPIATGPILADPMASEAACDGPLRSAASLRFFDRL
jgi:hypothetical protein